MNYQNVIRFKQKRETVTSISLITQKYESTICFIHLRQTDRHIKFITIPNKRHGKILT
jgi:hypothetical protein